MDEVLSFETHLAFRTGRVRKEDLSQASGKLTEVFLESALHYANPVAKRRKLRKLQNCYQRSLRLD